MHPKTFHVALPQALFSGNSFGLSFYVHAADREAALDYVEQLLPGLDLSGLRVNAPRPARPTFAVGMTPGMARVTDCDLYRSMRSRKAGAEADPPGFFRRSQADVDADLLRLFEQTQAAYASHVRAFRGLSHEYQHRNGPSWYRDRCEELRRYADRALQWQDSLWAEYSRRLHAQVLEMPPLRVVQPVALSV